MYAALLDARQAASQPVSSGLPKKLMPKPDRIAFVTSFFGFNRVVNRSIKRKN
jgi:hypothetical protein